MFHKGFQGLYTNPSSSYKNSPIKWGPTYTWGSQFPVYPITTHEKSMEDLSRLISLLVQSHSTFFWHNSIRFRSGDTPAMSKHEFHAEILKRCMYVFTISVLPTLCLPYIYNQVSLIQFYLRFLKLINNFRNLSNSHFCRDSPVGIPVQDYFWVILMIYMVSFMGTNLLIAWWWKFNNFAHMLRGNQRYIQLIMVATWNESIRWVVKIWYSRRFLGIFFKASNDISRVVSHFLLRSIASDDSPQPCYPRWSQGHTGIWLWNYKTFEGSSTNCINQKPEQSNRYLNFRRSLFKTDERRNCKSQIS